MGAYLSQPITKKESRDGSGEHLLYGDSSMQGWRVSQEDAHNSLPDLAPGCSLFAVYDGHGGHEVAAYAAQTLPAAITACPLYKSGKVRESLRRAFLEFDSSLTRPEIIEKLKILAGREIESEDEEETDREVDELFQEAHMPLDELMARYQGGGDKPTPPAAAGGVAKLKGKTKEKPLSPFLRAKAGGSGAGSSSSGAGGSSSGSSAAEDADVKKDLTAEIKSEEKSESADGVKSEPSTDTAATETKVKAESDVKADPDAATDTAKESNSEPNSESKSEIIKAESKSPVKSADKADGVDKPASKTNGNAGSGEPADSADTPADGDASKSAGGDAPACNGNGTASSKSSPRGKGGKGARPGSGKSPAPAAAAAAARGRAAVRGTRRLPERAAAEVYKEVLEGARKAREAGHDHVEDEEEEEDEDDDFSLEQSDSVDDDDNDVEDEDDDDDEEEEEEEEEEEDDDDSEEEDDEMGDEESAEDEDSDFMFNMKDEPGSDSGCTAVVALLHGRQLYVANIGDSRCVLSRSGRAVDMSDDHKPEDEPELQRIVKAGGKVTMDGRVNGGLNLSRAFGDHAYKADAKLPAEEQMISACPDVRCVTIEPGTDEFMVLACDGIWNSKKSQEVVDFVSERIRERGETQLSKICEELFDECLASNTMGDGTGCDNMTCIIVRFMPSLATVPAPIPVEDGATDSATASSEEKTAKTEAKVDEKKTGEKTEEEATKEEGDASAAPRPDPEGAPPEKRQRTE